MLRTQKGQKIGGHKNLPPKNAFSERCTRGIRKNLFEFKIFGKIYFITFLGHFSENLSTFSKTAPSAPIFGPSGPKMGKLTLPKEILGGDFRDPLRFPTETVKGVGSYQGKPWL